VTLDATEWVWRHARSRGNARLAVLAVADKTTGPEAAARLGVAEAMRRLGGVGKGTAVKAIADAVAAGDLEIAEPAKGSRPALYRIPGAAGYVRRSGPESRPQTAVAERSGFQTGNGLRSGSQTTNAPASGPESGPVDDTRDPGLWSGIQTACGLESGPHHPPIERVNERVSESAPAPDLTAGGVPPFARPLVDKITASGVIVRWDLTPGEWLRLDAMLKRSGVDMLADHAVTIAARQRVSSARYFLRAWTNLPPTPAAGTTPATPTGNVLPFPSTTQDRPGRAAQAAQWYADLLAEEQ